MPYLPALAIAIILGTYWARVLKMVLKARKREGRDAANFVPRERLGRALRIIWYPTVTLWVVLPWIHALVDALPRPLALMHRDPFIAWPAVAVALAALAITWVCWKRMGKSWRMGIDPNAPTSLVVTGPYAYVRHPIYALSSLLMLATAVALPSWVMLVLAILHIAFLQWEARREERYLLELHGQEYAGYMSRTGRFIPLFRG
jgi:protein-S-isoprenylcysteine O-methyltransferase Ste14